MVLPTWVYREMEDRIGFTLKNCSGMVDLKRIHGRITVLSMSQSNFLTTKLVGICGANGEDHYAEKIFKHMEEPKNTFLYNAMVRTYTQCNAYPKALKLYKQMMDFVSLSPDRFTYPFVLKSCTALHLPDLGRQVHSQICRRGWRSVSVVENSLLEMYAKWDHLNEAHALFDEMYERDIVSWNTLLSTYTRLGNMKKARTLFNSIPHRTVISWTVLISGYCSIGCYHEAIEVFHEMQLTNTKPDDIAVVSVLPACAHLGALELGKWVHTFCEKNKLIRKTHVCNALMKMYSKCGCIDQALQLFNSLSSKDVISWSTMISGFAHHGQATEAVEAFTQMDVEPNSITFLALLSACAHAGLLSQGLQFFRSMMNDYGLRPSVEHYGCMVDLLGRSGMINEAMEVIIAMPFAPDAAIWGSLLNASRNYGDLERAITATEMLADLEPDESGNYVILSNVYAAAGRWDGVCKIRKMIRSQNTKRNPGCSSIEVENVVREFVAGDDSGNTQLIEISGILQLLTMQETEKIDDFENWDH